MPEMAAVEAPLDLPAVRAVGYRQAWEYLDGEVAMPPVSVTRRSSPPGSWPSAS
jgi:tRNA A37 N6-isopentenylltransferase MiaA